MLERAKIIAFVATADADRARAFYAGTLGLTLVADDPYALVFDANGTALRVVKLETVDTPPYTTLGWQVDDIEATARGLAERGVAFERYAGMGQDDLGLWSAGPVRVAWFKDPDGNLLSITGP